MCMLCAQRQAVTAPQEILAVTSIEADFALVRRYHDAHMESPFQLQADTALNRIEAHLGDLQRQKATFDLLRFQLESQRDQMAEKLDQEKRYTQELEMSHAAMGLVIESQDLRLKTWKEAHPI